MKPEKRKIILKERLKQLVNDYERLKRQNELAWNQYGSELCSGEMEEKEQEILKKISVTKKILEMPEIGYSDKLIEKTIEEVKNFISQREENQEYLIKTIKESKIYLDLLQTIKHIS